MEDESQSSDLMGEGPRNSLFHEERMVDANKKIAKLKKKMVVQKDTEKKLGFRLNLVVCALAISIGINIGLWGYCKCDGNTP